MFEKVRAIMAEQFRTTEDKIRPETDIKAELGADSLDVLQLLMAIEDTYGITVPDEELLNFVTVQDVVDYLEGLEAKKNG
ncbi:MAG: acyl carrier protein [Lachnospiraceae bacterium]|nr:acyl carrier protein [Lachnospiraceae bacterium]